MVNLYKYSNDSFFSLSVGSRDEGKIMTKIYAMPRLFFDLLSMVRIAEKPILKI